MKNRLYGALASFIFALEELLKFSVVILKQFNMRLKYIYYILAYNVYQVRGTDNYEQFNPVGSLLVNNWGPVIPSAVTIAPTYRYHIVSGVVAIVNITVPYTGFRGRIVLIPTGIWTWTAAGNIFVAGTTTAGNGVPVAFDFDGSKWYPSRIT